MIIWKLCNPSAILMTLFACPGKQMTISSRSKILDSES